MIRKEGNWLQNWMKWMICFISFSWNKNKKLYFFFKRLYFFIWKHFNFIKKLQDVQQECRCPFSYKCLPQVILKKFQTNSNDFDISQSEAISSYLVISRAIRINYWVWNMKYQTSSIKYQSSSINNQVLIIKYQYQPSGTEGTCSLPATPQRLQCHTAWKIQNRR